MNLLFVNYGDFTSNSLNHIGAFANRLTLLGHACVVAVPDHPETISTLAGPLFTPVTFARAFESEPLFPDRRGADLVHAWTPRENVREFTLAYLRRFPAATLIIHLEDNEVFLIESYAHEPLEKLRALSDEELATRLSPRLSHPVRFGNFLRLAHGVTYITDRLREFVPDGKPAHRLLPGVDTTIYRPLAPDSGLRAEIGVRPEEKLLLFTGSTTFANLADVRTLLLAVRLLNERGTPCKLVRTGINPPELARELAALGGEFVIDLGFLDKARLGPLLALADVLVQPGTADAFNDYRLPSKIPEFLSVGRPVVIPRANLAHEMTDGTHALLLTTGTPDEIAKKCQRIFNDPELARSLSMGALEFAHAHFDLKANTAGLVSFYEHVQASAAPLFTDPATPASEDVLLAEGDLALRMRAKEQTIAYTRGLLGASETTLVAREATLVERDATIAALEARLATRDRTVWERDKSIVELQEQATAITRAAQADKTLMIAQAAYERTKVEQARHRIEVLRAQLAEAVLALGHLARECESAKTRADLAAAEIAVRDDKIGRMRRSFSWQVTSPIRALRRAWLDGRRRAPALPAPTIPPEIDPSLTCTIDEPSDWNRLPRTGILRGWVLAQTGAEIKAIRLRAGDRTIEGTYRLPRADVAAAHPGHLHAAHCGFVIEYELPTGEPSHLLLEALGPDGAWRCFAAPQVLFATDLPGHLRQDYTAWIEQFDTPGAEKIVAAQAHLDALPAAQRPLISVVMPVYNTPEKWLVKAIESVRAQLYPNWELCIADDASPEPHVRTLLDEYTRRDARIRVVFRGQNGHISAASNSALDLATGEFVALLDHDDELAPTALSEIVDLLAVVPAIDYLYSDEDKIDEQGRRFDPYFKPDFLPDLFTAQNFASHLSVYRLSLVRAVGGFRVGYEGSQDWDLALRVADLTTPARIRHIPKILYHWRAIPGSTALAIGEKNYPVITARKALTDHFIRRGETVELLRQVGDYWRVKRPVPSPAPLVSLIIPTRNRHDLLSRCVGSLLAKTTYPRVEIIVVDNGSDEPSALTYLKELEALGVTVLRYDAPFNYSAINNFAVNHAHGEIIGLLNNDLEVINPDWLDEMVSHAVRPEIGCVGAMLYYPNDLIQHAGVLLGVGGVAGHAFGSFPRGTCRHFNRARLIQNYSAVTAACLVIRRATYLEVGGLNERELAIAFNDVDFCLRVLAAGYRNLWTPFAEFYHHESASRGQEDTPEKLARFHSEVAYMRSRWGRLLDRDPAYNPNLTLQKHDYSLAFPPRA